jgi:hypothetical protein
MKRKGLSLRRWLCSRGRGGSTFVLAGRGDLRLEAASGGGVLSPHSQALPPMRTSAYALQATEGRSL